MIAGVDKSSERNLGMRGLSGSSNGSLLLASVEDSGCCSVVMRPGLLQQQQHPAAMMTRNEASSIMREAFIAMRQINLCFNEQRFVQLFQSEFADTNHLPPES